MSFSTGKILLAGAIASSIFLAGCSDNNNSSPASFDITVTNLSAGQPLSPVAVALHSSSWQAFETGSAVSIGLEELAEGGDNTQFLADADADAAVYNTASGTDIIAPGESETITIEVNRSRLGTLSLSAVSMLVNTNDAITGLNGRSIASMAVNDSASFNALSYDSGTEANTETADTIPGPAAAGGAQEGFNAARDDVRDAVYVHPGVVTSSDGLATSTLTHEHRWDHPSVRVTVERTQ